MLGHVWTVPVKIDAVPETINLALYEGDALDLDFEFDHDLTGYHSFRAHIKAAPTTNAPVLEEFVVDAVDPEPNRTVHFHLTDAQVRLAIDGAGCDFECLDANNKTHTFAIGEITVEPQFTRP